MDATVVLPTYNERENIIPLIEAIQCELEEAGITHQVIIVDDDSPDGTAQVVRERFGDDIRVRLFVRTEERGLATAIAHGIRRAEGDVVVVMDTDFNHDPTLLPQMIKFLEYYDIIIGSRFTMGGGMEETWRYLASFTYNFFVRVILRTQVQDNLCGFFSIHRDVLMSMDLETIFHGYGCPDKFIRGCCLSRRYTILEVPAFYRRRLHGQSKSRFLHMLSTYTWAAIKIRLSLR